ncbi:DeoR/GlpR family DNA-binding transcription regulator [Bacillus sp. S13(2024)]|uniref:DeoR/GlpR family DNA-binding transcription regulator n=1 Tax=unclassified Bacillus (in: firmicutes) TaxID=185979 RepID=UPI003D1D91E1
MNLSLLERHQCILDQLEREKKIIVASLAKSLGVTPETIRRDLDILEKEKKLKRVHGGAVNYHQTNNEPHFNQKMNVFYDLKQEIGKKAAQFIQDGDTVMIDIGTTTIHLAHFIQDVQRVTIVTNSLAVADILNQRLEEKCFDGKVIILGGVLNPEQKSITGALTCKILQEFQFDKVFLSCGGITQTDVSDYDLEEAIVSAAAVKQASQIFVLADSSKVATKSFYRICPLAAVDYIICDQDMPQTWKKNQLDTMLQWIIAEGGERYES